METTALSDWINFVFKSVPDRRDEEVIVFLVTDYHSRFLKHYPFEVLGGHHDRLLPRVMVVVTAQLTPNVNISALKLSGCTNGRRVMVEARDDSLRSRRRILELYGRIKDEGATPICFRISFAGGLYVAYPPDFSIYTLYRPETEKESK